MECFVRPKNTRKMYATAMNNKPASPVHPLVEVKDGGTVNWPMNIHSLSPLPLPLPLPHNSNSTSPSLKSGVPQPRFSLCSKDEILSCALQSFSHQEISTACNCFSQEQCVYKGLDRVVYRASLMVEATVAHLLNPKPYKEFVMEVNRMASLQHPCLCKLIGFHAGESGDRMVVYERLANGGLDQLLLYSRANGNGSSPIDWSNRMKIAFGVAQGLAFLHEQRSFQVMYSEFRAANVQIDKDFNPKLSDYGFACEAQVSCNSSTTIGYLAPETVKRGNVSRKSNVWSFGVMLLELLTGGHPKDERDLMKWAVPFLSEESRLIMIMDPRLSISNISLQTAKAVADLVLKCLREEPSDRPTMRAIVETLKSLPDIRCCVSPKFPLKEPTSLASIKHEDYHIYEQASPKSAGMLYQPRNWPQYVRTTNLKNPPTYCS
ncbi:hypothetical protein SUGI_1177090 [Cryptomeria japonica]|uniref:probable serine/threonine-protein kinase PBL1 n=1 Tax=Cryptomeria japonica TaxID=3369 RepID=UPI002414912A|nr:probable serine/threonine-protein kinase PBL1 [Cryptomeria japonica]GLJ54805.1 hypothetical protein SUGI_1177090 [Cryptomeria japonica]